MADRIEVQPPPLLDRLSTILPGVEQVVMTALVKDPSQRFKRVHAFASALEQAYQPKSPIGTVLLMYRGHAAGVEAVGWSPDGSQIASGSGDGTVQIWDATTGARLVTYDGHNDIVWWLIRSSGQCFSMLRASQEVLSLRNC